MSVANSDKFYREFKNRFNRFVFSESALKYNFFTLIKTHLCVHVLYVANLKENWDRKKRMDEFHCKHICKTNNLLGCGCC